MSLNKIIKTAEHFKEIHSEEIASVGFNTIVEMLKKLDNQTYSLSELKKDCKEIVFKHGIKDVDYISVTIESNSFGARYSVSISGIKAYIRDCSTPKSLLKKLEDYLKDKKDEILSERTKEKEESNIELK